MKNIYLPVIAMFFIISSFAQGTAQPVMPDSIMITKHDAKIVEYKPSLDEVLKSIEGKMVRIDSGSFSMGCSSDPKDSCYYWEKPGHTVKISSFFMGKFPVTQIEWKTIMGTTPWYRNCAECPVEYVSWYDAQIFINTLNQMSGKYYRLPTEAEWEYAARGGKKSKGYKYPGSNNPGEVAWYDNNSGKQTHPVGQKKPNELGLYDMGGNVWQWCQDWFDDTYYSHSPLKDPQGPRRDAYRCCRGGSWWGEVKDCRNANRDRYPPDAKDDDVGFRLAMD